MNKRNRKKALAAFNKLREEMKKAGPADDIPLWDAIDTVDAVEAVGSKHVTDDEMEWKLPGVGHILKVCLYHWSRQHDSERSRKYARLMKDWALKEADRVEAQVQS